MSEMMKKMMAHLITGGSFWLSNANNRARSAPARRYATHRRGCSRWS
jgi:hypothetical protein